MRYSTIVLGVLTLVLGIYVVINWPSSYFEVKCTDPPEVVFSEKYNNAHDCDVAMVRVVQESSASCYRAVCRLVEE